MQITNFDATNIPPVQMGDKHPIGNFPFQITNTYGKKNNTTPGGQFVVEFTTPAGTILSRYNIWNESQVAREIAHKELSALCHATGIFKLSFEGLPEEQYGRELRGGRGTLLVGYQDPNKTDGYVEVKRIFDANGVEPGKGGAAPAPQTQQGGSWGAPATGQAPAQNNAPPANSGGGWGQPGGMQQQPVQQQAPAGNGGAAKPPWAS